MEYLHFSFEYMSDLVRFLNKNKVYKSEIVTINYCGLYNLIILTDRDEMEFKY
ncbi:MAG: hypothetical protein ACRC7N_04035 [Clostridium sp.]